MPLTDFSVSQGTGEKPQSKIWEHADQWWTVMPAQDGSWVWRLDGTKWTQALKLSNDNNVTADVRSVGDLTHVLLLNGATSQLASIEYDGAGQYVPWTMRPQLVDLSLAGTETATIDVDSTGRLWLAADNGNLVQVRYSDGLYASWSAPVTVASGIGSDDISVIMALPNGTVGVLWSNQNTKRFGFRYHVDGAAPNEWSADELPAAAAALNVGGGMADDHLNVAVASDGTIYAAVKTSYDSGGQTKLALIVRRPNGKWDDVLYAVDTAGTRPIALLNETAGKLIVVYAASEGTANIVYRETSLSFISFGPRQTMISGSIQNVSSTKQNFTDEVALIASNGSMLKSVLFSFGAIVVNAPPQVIAGLDQTVSVGGTAVLGAGIEDDGVSGPTTGSWMKASGPGIVTFDDSAKLNARATFSLPGTYVLRIVVTDGQYFDSDEVTVVVNPPTPDPEPSTTVFASFQDGAAGYGGTRDTMIRALNAQTNYGSLTTLEMDGSPDIASLVAWDVSSIPAGSVVLAASFEIYVSNTTVNSYDIYAVERAWEEFGATWNIARAGQAWATAGANAETDRQSRPLGTITARNTGVLRVDLNELGRAAVQSWITDPAENHGLIFQNYSSAADGLDFRSSETATVSQRPRLLITYSTPTSEPHDEPDNAAPVVNAGPDRATTVGQAAALAGSVTDDGLPGPVSVQWLKLSGPGEVAFGNQGNAGTSASFSAAGTYVLRLTASDGELSSFDELTVTVAAQPPANLPPTVNAGSDRTLSEVTSVALQGVVTDDGSPSSLVTGWTKTSGPGVVTFGNAASPATTASFSQPGVYVLRLTASDGEFTDQDEVSITIQTSSPPPAVTTTSSFQDGVAGYAGTRDTMLRALNASTNYGALNTLEVDGSPDIASLLSWNLASIPAGSTILSAVIELYVTNSTDDNYQLLAMARAWQEAQATWNQAASGNSWASSGANSNADRSATSLAVVSPRGTGRYAITLNADGIATVQRWIDDPSVNFGVIIQNYASASNGLDFRAREAADVTQRPKLTLTYRTPSTAAPPIDEEPANQPPQVFAGPDQTIPSGTSASLNAIANGDGAVALSVRWTQASGPGVATFADDRNIATSATFSMPGTYVLRLTASDGDLQSFDDVTVVVQSPAPANQPPSVTAGADQSIQPGSLASLHGSVSDDGGTDGLSLHWSKTSGPGDVTFGSTSAGETAAAFSSAGVYVLRLTASDGTLAAFDELTVNVRLAPTVDPSLIGHWEMENIAGGSVADSSGGGRTATSGGAPSLIQGPAGNGISLDKSEYLLVNNVPSLNPQNQITIAAWVKPTVAGTQYVVKKGRHDATDGYELSLSSDGKVFARFNQASSGDALRVNSTAKYPTNGSTWMHVAVTYDGATMKLYVNGELQASKNAVFSIGANNLPLAIGAQDDGYRGLAGGIDDVRIYSRALSAAEIAAVATRP